ncbi:MAG: replicative DNA helicase [Planctomycetota bacterium JB042]
MSSLYDEDVERAVVGAALAHPDGAAEVLANVRATDFGDVRARTVFEAMEAVEERHNLVDAVSVASELRVRKAFDRVGGSTYLAVCAETITSLDALPAFLRRVRQDSRRREGLRAIEESRAALRACHASDVDEVVAAAVGRLCAPMAADRESCTHAGTEARIVLEGLGEAADHRGVVRTGIRTLDEILQGLRPGELTLIAARPSVGKTSLATSIALSVALFGETVLLFTLEVDRSQMARNLLANLASVSTYHLRRGDVDEDERSRLEAASTRLASAPLYVDDDPDASIVRVRAKARRVARRDGLALIVVDYLQLLAAPKSENRNLAVASMSRGLKLLARQLHVPVVALSQLNRAVETREDRVPRLSDLRDSGSLEQDADVVLLLDRPATRLSAPPRCEIEKASVRVAKNRNGPTGSVRLRFRPDFLRFEEYGPEG